MNRLKKIQRILFLALLVVLAAVGLGIAGAVVPPQNRKRENSNEIKIELLDTKEEKTDQKTAKEFLE